MTTNLVSDLQSYFGFADFRSGQEEAIQSLLEGQHTLVVMPTGSGKSLVFQMTALQLPGTTLVISPLIALMKDQVDSLERRGIPATVINSTLTNSEQNQRLKGLACGNYRLIYIAPERLRSTQFLAALRCQGINLLAVDEAHCISEWGHDFRPDYLHIAKFRADFKDPLTVALTATATPQVQADIARQLGLSQIQRIVTGFNRPNLALELRYITNPTSRLKALRELLANHIDGASIIYTGTRRDAEEVAEFVRAVVGVNAHHYHAGLPGEDRTRIQDEFMFGDLSIVVATNAFGMGIDRQDMRQVIHYSLPGSLEAYYQEAGRAGRDELPARAVLLYSPEDRALQEYFIANNAITVADLRLLFNALRPASDNQETITIDDLSCLTSLQQIKVRVGLAELERAGALELLADNGLRMRVKLQGWDSVENQTVTDRLKQHQAHRKTQLDCMIAYAESNACRRRIILKHFGDSGPAQAEVCCDNCQERQSTFPAANPVRVQSQSELVAWIVLDTVRRMPRGVGKEKIAQILRGSKAKDILRFGYDKTTYYGRLAVFSMAQLSRLIDQLIELRYLKTIGGRYPILRLTPLGETAIHDQAPLRIHLPPKISGQPIEQTGTESQTSGNPDVKLAINHTILPFPKGSHNNDLRHIVMLGNARSSSAIDELIAYLQYSDGNARRLAASALGKIADKRATKPLMELLSLENKPQVRQYAVKALGLIGDTLARPLLENIAHNPQETEYTKKSAQHALNKIASVSKLHGYSTYMHPGHGDISPEDSVAAFLSRPHPRQLPGSWDTGWALGFHSQFFGAHWNRSETGELAYRLKYQGDLSVLPALVEQATTLMADHPELAQVDAIVPVPPSTPRPHDPVSSFAKALAQKLDIAFLPVLIKSRQTTPQKEMHTLAQKRANVRGAFNLNSPIKNKRLLVVDDLFDSGATLEEITRLLRRAGATQIRVLTLTRSIHSDA